MDLSAFEHQAMDALLLGAKPQLEILRKQFDSASCVSRHNSGVGFFVHFEVPPTISPVEEPRDFHIGDVTAICEELSNGIGLLIFIRDGYLTMLEGYTFDEEWPTSLSGLVLEYESDTRQLPF